MANVWPSTTLPDVGVSVNVGVGVGVGIGVGVGVTRPVTPTFCVVAPVEAFVTEPVTDPGNELALIRTSIIVDATDPPLSGTVRVEL